MMRFSYGGNADVPCSPTCPNRSAECHGACEAYKDYRAKMDEQCDARAKRGAALYISQSKERSRRERAQQLMIGRAR